MLRVITNHQYNGQKKKRKPEKAQAVKETLIPTCSLCANLDSLRMTCTLTGEAKNICSPAAAKGCQEDGCFVRYLHVLPDVYNYYESHEDIPRGWDQDLSSCQRDEFGQPLFLKTNRGLERAIPVDDSIQLRATPIGVPRILTKQGQREAIFTLGVEAAGKEAARQGVRLYVDEDLQDWPGEAAARKQHLDRMAHQEAFRRAEMQNGPWLQDKPTVKRNSAWFYEEGEEF